LRFYNHYSNDFFFEVFSPHKEDMISSNNSSLVCKITEKNTRFSYLITGDTENARWDSIVRIFGAAISANVLNAPHHGSRNGITQAAMNLINPHTVLISAGVNNKYGHPDIEALAIYRSVAREVYRTNWGNGESIVTDLTPSGVRSYLCT
jgi:beta-lactamase superfamily II metal-dependent hydrolase